MSSEPVPYWRTLNYFLVLQARYRALLMNSGISARHAANISPLGDIVKLYLKLRAQKRQILLTVTMFVLNVHPINTVSSASVQKRARISSMVVQICVPPELWRIVMDFVWMDSVHDDRWWLLCKPALRANMVLFY